MDLHGSVSHFLVLTCTVLAVGLLAAIATATAARRTRAWLGTRLSGDRLTRLDLLAFGGSLSEGHRHPCDRGALAMVAADPKTSWSAPGQATTTQSTTTQATTTQATTTQATTTQDAATEQATGADVAPPMPSERRDHQRFRTGFLGTLHPEAGALASNLCDILDLSASGARIRPVDPMPEMQSQVTVGLERLGLFPARVVWRHHGEVGLKFERKPEQVLAKLRGLLPMPEQDLRSAAQPAL